MKIRTKLFLGFGVIISLLVIIILVSYANSNKLIDDTNWIIHTEEVLVELAEVIAHLTDAETGQRGYIITGEERYLEPYDDSLIKINHDINHMHELIKDNPTQQEYLELLEPLINDKLGELKETIGLRRHIGFNASREVVLSDRGKESMDNIRQLVDEMIDEEKGLLMLRSQAPEESRRRTNILLIALLILGLAIGVGIAWYISISISRPLKKLISATQELGKGNIDDVVDIKTKDELKVLGDSFNETVKKIKQAKTSLKESETKFRSIFDNANDGIFLIMDGKFVDLNNKVLEIFESKRNQMIGKNPFDFSPKKQPDGQDSKIKGLKKINSALNGIPQVFEWQHIKYDKTPFDAEISLNRIELNGKMQIQAIVRDITEKKKIDKMKDELISVVTHELRTPLTSITSLSKLIQDKKMGPITDRQKKSLGVILKDSNRLAHLVTNLMDVQKIDSGKIEYTYSKFNLRNLINGVLKEFSEGLKGENISVDLKSKVKSSLINADKVRISQVLINLLENAIKYGKRDGHIWITITKQEDGLVVEVKDDGVGISKKDVPRLFTRMFQAKGAYQRIAGGIGFGLYISKRIVEDGHGGKIWVESVLDKGSSFYFSLPLKLVKILKKGVENE